MPALGQSEVCSYSPMEGTCYAQLQPVAMDFSIGRLITSSTNMCLPEDLGDSSCSGYPVGTQSYQHAFYSSDDSGSPHSPEKDLSDIQEVLQQRMTGRTDDDDDASVMFDFQDLAFLDHYRADSDLDSLPDRTRPQFSTVIVQDRAYYTTAPPSHHARPSPRLPTTTTSPAAAHNNHHAHIHPHHHNHQHQRQPWPMHFTDSRHIECLSYLSPSPCSPSSSPSPSPQLPEGRRGLVDHPLMGGVGEESEDDDDDAEYKPYCDSRRGAKKNLLWKFLLWVLDHHTDLAQWTDMRKGVFKFVDTARISTMWGQRKHKRDMTFEKLSRGIRHYYKRGLMERLSNTRLVYKFNWEKVPKRYRKA